MGDFLDFLCEIVLPSILLVALCVFGVLWVTYVIVAAIGCDPKAICNAEWRESKLESKWVDDIGCMVKTEKYGWIPADKFNTRGE